MLAKVWKPVKQRYESDSKEKILLADAFKTNKVFNFDKSRCKTRGENLNLEEFGFETFWSESYMPRIGIGYNYRETQNERDELRSNSEENFTEKEIMVWIKDRLKAKMVTRNWWETSKKVNTKVRKKQVTFFFLGKSGCHYCLLQNSWRT